MKECPKCGNTYTDKTLSFCLSDGSILIEEATGEKTEILPEGIISTTEEHQPSLPTRQSNLITDENLVKSVESPKGAGVSPFWLLSTFALMGIIFGGAVVAWILYTNSSSRTETAADGGEKNVSSAQTTNSTTNTESPQDGKSTENEPVPDVLPTVSKSPSATKSPRPTKTPRPTKSPTPKPKSYKVVGVKAGDVLYIRPKPGNLKVVAGKIPPGASGVRIVGGGKRVGKSIWVPIVYKGKRGWVNRRYLGRSAD
ncbi:MAG: hypothetical protein HKN25_12920 [Pyrinomonadaceae bacterium]|nr:hypothetical protein [Pyrinomonadaceae bacterium]